MTHRDDLIAALSDIERYFTNRIEVCRTIIGVGPDGGPVPTGERYHLGTIIGTESYTDDFGEVCWRPAAGAVFVPDWVGQSRMHAAARAAATRINNQPASKE